MNLYEEYKLYETMWEEQETGSKAVVYIKDLKKKKAICDKLSSGYKKVQVVTDVPSFLRNSTFAKDGVEFYADTEGMKELKDALADKPDKPDKQSAAILKATKVINESTENSLDEALTESDDPYGYGPYKKFSDPDLEVGDYVLTTRPFSRDDRTYPARITSISSKWIEYEISGFGFTDKGTKARPGSDSDSAIRKATAHLGLNKRI